MDYYCWLFWCERKILFWLKIYDRLRPSEQDDDLRLSAVRISDPQHKDRANSISQKRLASHDHDDAYHEPLLPLSGDGVRKYTEPGSLSLSTASGAVHAGDRSKSSMGSEWPTRPMQCIVTAHSPRALETKRKNLTSNGGSEKVASSRPIEKPGVTNG